MPVMEERTRSEGRGWREQLLQHVDHWSALFGGVIAIGVTIRAVFFDFVDVRHPAFVAMFVGYGAIAALRFLHGLSYRVQAVALSSAGFVAARQCRVPARPRRRTRFFSSDSVY